MELISYADFAKLDLRTARILSAERVPGTDKLLKLFVKMGVEERTIASGIADFYSPEELVGKTIVVIANLERKKIRGVESQGMLLAAVNEEDGGVVLLTLDKPIEDGVKIG